MQGPDAGSQLEITCRTKTERVYGINELLFVATSHGQFSWEMENAVRDEERRGREGE